MSFSFPNFLNELLADAKAAMTIAGPIISVAETAAPVLETFVPSSIPVITGIEAGAAAIAKVAPTAVSDTMKLIAEGEAILADLGPTGARLSSIFGTIFQKTPVGQATVLSPVTTAPTVPPAPALS